MPTFSPKWFQCAGPVIAALCLTLLTETFIVGVVIINVMNTVSNTIIACCGV